MPSPDEIDRDKLYAPDVEDDGAEYELEPPDAAVVAAEERRAKEAIEATKLSIDIDEIYREVNRDHGGEILEKWTRDFQLRFRVKHLLMATAVVAILLTLAKLNFGTTLVVLLMISVAGLYLYLQWQEKKRRDEADRRRQVMYARRRAHFRKVSGETPQDEDQDESLDEEADKVPAPLPNEVDEAWQEAMAREKFRVQFSLRQLLAAMASAAVLLGLVHVMGSPANAAIMLGFIALGGLVIHAIGVEPPEILVLAWWLTLVMYVLLSIVAAVWSGFA